MANHAKLTLYVETLWISPYVFSSFFALRTKGVPFGIEEVALLDNAHQEPKYRDRSLTAKVPALAHNGFCLAESSAIAEYLEEVFPPPGYPRLFPADVRDRARARQIMAWIRSDLAVLRDERPTTTMFFEPAKEPLSPAGQADAQKLIRVADQLVPGSGGPLFGAWCLADTELAFMLQRLVLNRDPVPERLRAFADAEWAKPAAQEFAQHARADELPEKYWQVPFTRVVPARK